MWDKLRKYRPSRLAGSFLLSCGLAAGQWGALYAPWSVAFVASRGASPRGFAALLGALLGGYLFFPFQAALRHGATVLLIYAAALSFAGSRWEKRTWFAPLCGASSLLVVHSVYLVGREFSHSALYLLAAGTVWLLSRSMQGLELRERTEVVGLGVCLSLSQVMLDGFSLGRLGAVWLALWLGSGKKPAEAAALGGCIGLTLDLTTANPAGTLAAILTVSCYGASLSRSRSIRAVSFCALITALAVLLRFNDGAALAFETFTASAAYLITPKKLRSEERGPVLLSESCTPRAGAFRALYDALFGGEEDVREENPAVIFDRAAEKVCRTCPRMAQCYQKNYQSTHDAFARAAPRLLCRGQAQRGDFPDWFIGSCERFSPFLGAVNDETYAYLLRTSYQRRLRELRKLAALPYAQMGAVMEEAVPAATEERAVLEIYSATRPKSGQALCGDETAVFTVGAVTYLLLSDGMGSGTDAHAEASMTVRLLRQFLEAGITAEASLRTLNTALRLREGDSFTTIDLAVFRRNDGTVQLHKYGACHSYCRRSDGKVEAMGRTTLPAGLETETTVPLQLRLRHGDVLVMVSDGVVNGRDDTWLRETLQKESGSMQALTRAVLAGCTDSDDDCAVIAARCRRSGATRV